MQSLLDPAILFFALGVFAGLVRSNLEMPAAISKFLSIYLLMALGLKGGFALAASGLTPSVLSSLGLAMLLAVVVPLVGYVLLRRVLSGFNAAAVAATYGSVSAVTFVTATQYLESQAVPYGGYMAAAMALMESPAIILAVMLANAQRQRLAAAGTAPHSLHTPTVLAMATPGTGGVATATPRAGHGGPGFSMGKILHESFTDGTQLLLLGAMVIGLVTGDAGKAAMQPFSGDLFKGMLCLFLLDMGLATARNLPAVRHQSPWLLAYAVLGPLVHASLALGLAWVAKVPAGDAVLLMVLAASASYIAVPAVVRFAIPEADPSLYVSLSLGLTFPLNIVLGIPLYTQVVQGLWGA
ncbi:MAG: sodium-dependent bicarbonate transport family permease [Gammaproteobacteria bacterium]|nr:sodium-dependent bicarbonate transport family permease [Gammaproteobacteria bacterium]MBU1505276.1 sodium-dependent bicarbonate transport family permease [Gammaproteobacteria bacterium]MBU2122779.1 sodium-dependent bicarbonate transport family permease [Gammaproteobacteria bacterium]MBU2173017.1 sodium-dependent bicarbonate transport family permease [Gammaproteobacteria bacterium]MBU2199742.1 sodium-dependent bicarbonate transport family permease [Gammaproteobacteria bacterium]